MPESLLKPVSISLESKHLADQIAANEIAGHDHSAESNKTLWLRLAEQILMDGIPKQQVSTECIKIIEEKMQNKIKDKNIAKRVRFNNSWFFKVMSQNDYTNPDMVRNGDTDSINPDSSLNKIFSHTGENQRLITALIDFRENIHILRKYADKNPFLTVIDKDLQNDILTRLEAYNTNFSDYFNDKSTIPQNAQILFLQLHNAATDINNTYGLFFDEIKKIHTENRKNTKKTNQILTSKEMKKFQEKDLVRLNDSLEFLSANEARLHGFYGQQCPNCQGYRTKVSNDRPDTVYCLKCHQQQDHTSFEKERFVTCRECRYFIEGVALDKKKLVCPHCSCQMVLPSI